MHKYFEKPNLEMQIHEPDSYGGCQETLDCILGLAKDIPAHSKWEHYANVFNSTLIWLGIAEGWDGFDIPILGARTIYGSGYTWYEQLVDVAYKAQEIVMGGDNNIPFVFISVNHHHANPFENGSMQTKGMFGLDRVYKQIIPETQWESYELRNMPYREFLETGYWMDIKHTLPSMFDHRCALCNTKTDLQPHHRTYERRGHEMVGDLIPLCRHCHEWFHKYRKLAGNEPF